MVGGGIDIWVAGKAKGIYSICIIIYYPSFIYYGLLVLTEKKCKLKKIAIILLALLSITACIKTGEMGNPELFSIINQEGKTIQDRINVPRGFERVPLKESSFGNYLRSLPLKPHGSKVKYYNGEIKYKDVYVAVIDMDIGNRDLQQCADAVMRLRAEYLYQQKKFDQIHFNFTNGFKADYKKWVEGYRIEVVGNRASWVKKATYSTDYDDFRKYLNLVFAYAGTLSLEQELKPVKIENMEVGDVFIKGGSPGHCVIVVDLAVNQNSGEKIFLLAQSYMPAQDIQLLKNLLNKDISPWYLLTSEEVLQTPEWTFNIGELKRFED
ncbi:MAG: hypothetical protein DDT40_01247 [candidate division WS2 bacterium]|nr:hypothetical protein [Candidatus Psychracetigena formicireducens]